MNQNLHPHHLAPKRQTSTKQLWPCMHTGDIVPNYL